MNQSKIKELMMMVDSILPDHYVSLIDQNEHIRDFVDVFRHRLTNSFLGLHDVIDQEKANLNGFRKVKIKSRFFLYNELTSGLSDLNIAKINIEENLPNHIKIHPKDRFDFGNSFGMLGEECIVNDRVKITILFHTSDDYKQNNLKFITGKIMEIVSEYCSNSEIAFGFAKNNESIFLGEFKLN